MIRPRGLRWLIAVPAIVVGLPLLAQQEVARIPIIDAPPGTPGLGGGLRWGSNPYRGDTDGQDLVPLYLFEGKYLFAHGTSFGVHAFRNEHFKFDVMARYRFLGLDPESDDYLEGIEERRQTLDVGVSGSYQRRWGSIKLDVVTDSSNRYDGVEVDLTYRYRFDRGSWMFSPFAGLVWQSSGLTEYYFGVSEDEALPLRPAYSPGDAYNFTFGVNSSYQFSDSILGFFNFGLIEFDDSIGDSPIVEQGTSAALFVGAAYMFGNAMEPAKGAGPNRESEWSWRLNYGYQASGNIVGEINHGDFSKSEFADTNIAGFTLGKLFNDGPRVDFSGKLATYRHLENDLQDDFWSFSAYIMAMGKAYLGWSDTPFFRWGFGFGASYAQEIPIVEQIKQERRDRETSRFLNYLEMQLDFSLNTLTKGHAGIFRNCYTGVTLVHRSGIAASSDILGNVDGGSDWITLHLECMQ